MSDAIHRGKRLASDESIVWQGYPSWRHLARHVFHMDWIAFYLVVLLVLNGYQARAEGLSFGKGLHDSMPLIVAFAGLLTGLAGLAWQTGRSSRYTVTTRRVIMEYGIAIPATLSLPFARVRTIALATNPGGVGDISLCLRADDHVTFLKLWPHARPFRIAHPEPMLRCVPQAAVVANLLTRAVLSAEQVRLREAREKSAEGSRPSPAGAAEIAA